MKETIELIAKYIPMIGIMIAGVWAYFRIKIERSHTPHIELDIDCNLHGPQKENYLSEIVILINNKGLIRQDFQSMQLKIRAIEEDSELEYYDDKRLKGPEKILEVEMIKKKSDSDYLFVEPGTKHLITYATKLPEISSNGKKFKYLLIRSKFYYKNKIPHSIERLYCVDQCLNKEKKLYCV